MIKYGFKNEMAEVSWCYNLCSKLIFTVTDVRLRPNFKVSKLFYTLTLFLQFNFQISNGYLKYFK